MSEQHDYLNTAKIYPDGEHEMVIHPLPFEPDPDDCRPELYPPKRVPGLIEEEEG